MNTVAHLSNDDLDAIATHAGVLALVLNRVNTNDILPFMKAELERLESLACDELQRRGVISELFLVEGDEI